MNSKRAVVAGLFALAACTMTQAQETGTASDPGAAPDVASAAEPAPVQITMGNGEANAIKMDGLERIAGETVFTLVRVDPSAVSTMRANTTALRFAEVMIERPGFIVLHPVIDGRPDGDMVSGFAYLEAGLNTDVIVQTDHPADPGDRFLVMLHSDVNDDRVLDFVFLEDGINVEDGAVFEGTQMIAHVFTVPE